VVAIGKIPFLATLREAKIPPEKVTSLLRSSHALLSSKVFSEMTPSALAHIIGTCSRQQYSQGEDIIKQGEEGDSFFIVESGNVEVYQDGGSAPIAKLGPGEYFGELALLLGRPRSATVTAAEPCVLLRLNQEGFRSVLAHDFQVALRMEDTMSERTSTALLRPS